MRIEDIRTPSYLIDEGKLRHNLEILKSVEDRSGAHILLAQKAYSIYQTYPLIAGYLTGATASGIYEARLAHEEMMGIRDGLENHVFEPAFKDDEMAELCDICDHIVFNSMTQLEHHRSVWEPAAAAGSLNVALRINPEYRAEDSHEIYDPCAPGSRLGIRNADMPDELPEGVTGIHFHNLCEEGFEPLKATFQKVEKDFKRFFPGNGHGPAISWINLGGGHHITKEGYDIEGLVSLLSYIRDEYGIRVYLEPGEAIALDAGYLITTVMDIVRTDKYPVLILDASAACHMPDVLEMPYRPPLKGSGQPGEKPYTYRLSSRTCLAGDIIGDYSFDREIGIGDRLVFEDMAIYSMVKNNTFNGMALPSIMLLKEDGDASMIRSFGYEDFKCRL
ncbi:carboxynorspermidine decarboxylase [Butyrivibrio sp. MC2013]|uniref:carboxynorspermidine decarboxylase n=1 Tax=Butyrivibrio sp. MC2013 TaxID=1280686 RepID=UPI00040DFD4E|nr:carboxynorspermidine decarboxylase [Butyrivibrio sp. MC2013]